MLSFWRRGKAVRKEGVHLYAQPSLRKVRDKGTKQCSVSVLVNDIDAVVQKEVSLKCGKS